MEEIQRTAAQAHHHPPQTAAQTPPQPPIPSLPPKSRKRKLDNNVQIQNSKYYKMRLVLRDLRPHFIEVLRTPDFRNCKAADEIREKMKVMMELYQQMTGESVCTSNFKNVTESKPSLKENGFGKKLKDQSQRNRVTSKPSENRSSKPVIVSDVQIDESGTPRTYIVGGSAFGWNFITYMSSKPVYYGITKESFRTVQAKTI